MDIELNSSDSGLDGMALARKIRERDSAAQPVIVFVTGYGPRADLPIRQHQPDRILGQHLLHRELQSSGDTPFEGWIVYLLHEDWDLEAELSDLFFRIHKGYLVNLSYVEAYSKTEVTLISGDKLLLSKYKYQDFVKAYLRFLKRGWANE